jgi:hypothetical protein
VAKKRKAAATTRGAKKKKGAKKKTAARRTRAVAAAPAGFDQPMAEALVNPKQVHFGPLKAQIKAHIERLRTVQQPSTSVLNALRSLEQVQADLTGECLPSMILNTP